MVNIAALKQMGDKPSEKPLVESDTPQPVRHTAQELKAYFLQNAQPLVKEYIDAALGKGELSSTNMAAREEVWSILKQLMVSSSDKLDMDINSAQDVLEAVSKGKCTFEEAQKLLDMYKQMSEIENKALFPTSGSNNTGFTINILGSAPVEQTVEVLEHED